MRRQAAGSGAGVALPFGSRLKGVALRLEESRPASAHIVRIGTENVRSFPYRAAIVRAIASGSSEPAAWVSHRSAAATAGAASSPETDSAAQPSAVVLTLLK